MSKSNEVINDGRLPKQLGDFGESLVCFVLGNLKKYRVAVVDHEGADLIASDRKEDGEKFAISVKTRWFKTDDPSTTYKQKDQEKLRQFAEEFGQTSLVAFVLINKAADTVDIYILKLSDFERLAKDTTFPAITTRGLLTEKPKFSISNAAVHHKILQNHPLIDHTQLTLSFDEGLKFNP